MTNAHPIIRQIVGRDCHVSLSNLAVVRHVVSKLKNGFETLRALSKTDRRRFFEDCIKVHRENRSLYLYVMTGSRRKRPAPKKDGFPQSLSGAEVVSLMRKHKTTIKGLAFRTGITQKTVRQIRERGLLDPLAVRDWIEVITGIDPGPIPRKYRIGRITEECQCNQCGCPLETGDTAFEYVSDIFCSISCTRRSRGWE